MQVPNYQGQHHPQLSLKVRRSYVSYSGLGVILLEIPCSKHPQSWIVLCTETACDTNEHVMHSCCLGINHTGINIINHIPPQSSLMHTKMHPMQFNATVSSLPTQTGRVHESVYPNLASSFTISTSFSIFCSCVFSSFSPPA
jgi:hypothetical protein